MGPPRLYSLTLWVRRLLVANLLVFLIQKTLLVDPSFLSAFGFDPLHAWERPWTFVTYMFLHANIPHLLFNMLMLLAFGGAVEERMGGRSFVLFYLLCGLGGATLSFLLMQLARVGIILGASGAILGVTFAFVSDPVAHLAHLGGVGTAFLYLKGQHWWETRDERRARQTHESSVLVSQARRASRSGMPPSARSTKRSDSDARATAEIDRVLDKINASGVESLTPAERRFLTEISRRMRKPPKG